MKEANNNAKQNNGQYLSGSTDYSPKPLYQNLWYKLGIERLGYKFSYNITGLSDDYYNLTWWSDYKIDNYSIRVFDVKHGGFKPSFGFIISNKIAFSGDSSLCDGIEKALEEVDYAVLDTSFLWPSAAHMDLDTFIKLSEKYQNTILIPTHMNDDVRMEAKKLSIKNIKVYDDLDILKIK